MHLAHGAWTAMLSNYHFHENRFTVSVERKYHWSLRNWNALNCCTVLQVTVLTYLQCRNTTQRNATQHNTTQHNTTQHNTTQHNTTQFYKSCNYRISSNTIQHSSVIHTTTTCPTSWHSSPLWFEFPKLTLPKIPVFCDVILSHWATSSQHFKGLQCLHL
jgi:YesN/AraC family two-component response regulator